MTIHDPLARLCIGLGCLAVAAVSPTVAHAEPPTAPPPAAPDSTTPTPASTSPALASTSPAPASAAPTQSSPAPASTAPAAPTNPVPTQTPPASAPLAGTTNTPTASPGALPPNAVTPTPDALAAAHMVGTETVGAGTYFLSYGLIVSSLSPLYGTNGVIPVPEVALGLAVGGLLNASVGAVVVAVGARRAKATDAWLDANPSRRRRFTAKAIRRGLYIDSVPHDAQTETVARQGVRTMLRGTLLVMSGGVLNGVGVAVAPLSSWAGLGLNAVGTSTVIAGAILSARGKRRAFRPRAYGGTPTQLSLAPTVLRTPSGARAPALSLTGRF